MSWEDATEGKMGGGVGEDEEKGISSYWMTLRKRHVLQKRKH
jgi:hypothetical protein